MVVVYTCYGGSHSSVVAAAIHTRVLQPYRRPSLRLLQGFRMFDRSSPGVIGSMQWVGRDAGGNDVFALGLGRSRRVFLRALLGVLATTRPTEEILLVDTLHLVGTLARVGGTLSRGLGMVWPGRTMVAAGILICYQRLSELVLEVEEWLGQHGNLGQ